LSRLDNGNLVNFWQKRLFVLWRKNFHAN
jgi:hypothetical protein